MVVEGYEMLLYCDYQSKDGMPSSECHAYGEGTGDAFGHTKPQAYADAISKGWKFSSNKCHCPKHRQFPISKETQPHD